jgi:hypothetical protein
MKAEVLEEVKKEVEKMLEAGFIRPCRYAEWISSVVPLQKKCCTISSFYSLTTVRSVNTSRLH